MPRNILILSLLVLFSAVNLQSQAILHYVSPIPVGERYVGAYVTFDGITTFTGQYRQGCKLVKNSDIGVKLHYGSEDPTTYLSANLDLNIGFPSFFGGKTLMSFNPYFSFARTSVDIQTIPGVELDNDVTSFTFGAFGLIGYDIITQLQLYGGPEIMLTFTEDDNDFDFELSFGAHYKLNERITLTGELSRFLDVENFSFGALFNF